MTYIIVIDGVEFDITHYIADYDMLFDYETTPYTRYFILYLSRYIEDVDDLIGRPFFIGSEDAESSIDGFISNIHNI